MWDTSLVIPKYIVTPYLALVDTLEKFCKCTSNFVAPRIQSIFFICVLLSTCPTNMANLFVVGRGLQIYKNRTSNGGNNWGWLYKKWQEHLFVIDNVREAIVRIWSDRPEESYLIKKEMSRNNVQKVCSITTKFV